MRRCCRSFADQKSSFFPASPQVNDVKNRYLITKAATQQQLRQETGASLTTKGTWYPDRNLATPDKPPLYIHIEATSQEILDKALARVNEIINSEAPQLIEERGMRGSRVPPPGASPDRQVGRPGIGAGPGGGGGGPPERRRWPEEKIPIGIEPLRNFNVRAKVVGPTGMFVKYIQAETGTRVQIKGRGSGFIDNELGRESDEEMHINISGPDEAQLAEAKRLAEDLLDAVRGEWEKARQMLESQGYGPIPPLGSRPGGSGWGQRAASQGQQGPHGQMPPTGPAGGAASPGAGPGAGAGYGTPTGPSGAGGYGGAYGAQGQSPHQPQGQSQPQQWGAGAGAGASPYGHSGTGGPAAAATDPQAGAASNGSASAHSAQAQAQPKAEPDAAQAALDKYWKDYIAWEDSFRAYHNRMPTKEDGGQDVPPQYRR